MNEIWSTLLQTVLEVVITVAVPVVVGFAVTWVRYQISAVKSKMTNEQLAFAAMVIREAVLAAEQNGLNDAIANEGSKKREWVLAQVESILAKRGISLDLEELALLLESAVHEAFEMEG